jgi:hypothetical protein
MGKAAMSCEHLICAACARPVVEGRCPACRNAREKFHHHGSPLFSPVFLGLMVVLVLALTALKVYYS